MKTSGFLPDTRKVYIMAKFDFFLNDTVTHKSYGTGKVVAIFHGSPHPLGVEFASGKVRRIATVAVEAYRPPVHA